MYALVIFNIVLCNALDVNFNSSASICNATKLIQQGILDYYEGLRPGGRVGFFQEPYYWWMAGDVFGGMVENWYLCDNTEYKDLLTEAMVSQIGENKDYVPWHQRMVEGNDDQGIWGLLVMDAAERDFPDAPPDQAPGWLALAQAVFNTMWARWDMDNCAGGLLWQIYPWNVGYDYKNTISNGYLFQIAARLARFTGNSTYGRVAETVFDWLVDSKLVQLDNVALVLDGAHVYTNCTDFTRYEWTYNYGVVLGGCAYMYNFTNGSPVWANRLNRVLNGALLFFENGIMYERTCQDVDRCNNDQRFFKSIFTRMLALTSVLAPHTKARIEPNIRKSAEAAAKSCNGGSDGHTCGLVWRNYTWDGKAGLGEQLCALEIIQNTLIHTKRPPLTAKQGAKSKGDPAAGLNSSRYDLPIVHPPSGQKSSILTTLRSLSSSAKVHRHYASTSTRVVQ
ncbi:ACL202Wp [Eremothecium gossypii ATCC 10895]|uniref:Mannan endo-1,6-alpha-mannosidase n=1 Tax=Eremothecium gossypii (strain ATCC 10895 / CBS 109.51 / FGSC 9923 / NRRL Y-1056) TaxID=284811 RepID=Q75CW8_EREGS|nr:ACL202Wp [Eremothecium gossypii ATCC 10895]AAS51026.1 ACL202Wp [Eremothecium gossypii ATCC 10895]AEY95316.1 FACL202Wp [Eremothecium gossypii FDAG1]